MWEKEKNLKKETSGQLAVLDTSQKKRKSKLTDRFGNDINSTGSFLNDLSLTSSECQLLDNGKSFKVYCNSNLEAKRPRQSDAAESNTGASYQGFGYHF